MLLGCASEVRHRAVLKVVEKDAESAAAAASGSPRCVQASAVDVMSQSVPTEFSFSATATAGHHVYNSHTDVRRRLMLWGGLIFRQ